MRGTCKKCGHELEMHYELFCPKCDRDVLLPKTLEYYDFFKVMIWLEHNGYPRIKDELWDYICDNYDINNDSYERINLFYCDENDEEDKIGYYFKAIRDLLHIKDDNKSTTFWISW